jgi:serine phosphatase RsbU (regulator of sigma subunit)
MFPDAKFQERRVMVLRGCSIVVYTDGLSDALNSDGEQFGEERIMRCLASLPTSIDAQGICKHLAGRVAEWTAGADRFDDTTILALSCLPLKHNANGNGKLHLGDECPARL